ncbi:HRDC domain [Arabidopsis thaliana x Arabidopsis arenosa]|uniref:HRDC domain n=1 Tax=Arabidopsis thaliana x Arabidopsis arenosa TaxID=1240361 RepID=A0A8T1YBT7_9BRAS|nr:HRDC domain [Arabidopsis thaliana x Arabidopsis arenosa]
MSDGTMDVDESPVSWKVKSLEAIVDGAFSSILSKLSSSSRLIPSSRDFHFYYNFDEFKRPIDDIAGSSQSVLETIGDSEQVWGKSMKFPGDVDEVDAEDWLCNVNDEFIERFDVSVDEFQRIRKKEEEIGRPVAYNGDDGFQMVYGKKKKPVGNVITGSAANGGSVIDVKMAERDKNSSGKAKVPFHVPTIKKPQEEYNILVNNANQPFEHVWLERSEDDQRAMHPLEKLSVLDFVDKDLNEMEPVKPLPLEETPFKFVQEVKDLKELVAKLRGVEEFAVDLEHNQYRSFQGLTCLMQISTRTEDYIVDTFKLRIHIGPYLREIFKDPKKKKIMHGADRDIIWLQRDFGIYVCNLFDTGQASRVLNLERNSLEFLLQHFCGVTANKEYQNADWRIRPLPEEMTRYAREDTHYLLYIYDVIRLELQRMAKDDELTDSPLLEVYKRSYDVCTQLYEKELLTENSYLHIYGLQAAGFNSAQLAIVAGLCEWRDFIARAEDESTGYVLPNKVLLEIAKEMPVSVGKLRRMLKSKHPYIERNVDSVVSVIRQSIQNSAAFESAALSLKDVSPVTVMDKNIEPISEKKDMHAVDVASPSLKENSSQLESTRDLNMVAANTNEGRGLGTGLFGSAKVSAAVRISKKPSSGLGALLGSAASKKKSRTDEKVKEDVKLEQIRSSVNLSFHSFTEKVPDSKSTTETTPKVYGKPEEMSTTMQASVSKEDGVTELKDDSEEASEIVGTSGRVSESKVSGSETGDIILLENGDEKEVEAEDEPMSLSELSTNFQKCFKSMKKSNKAQKQTDFLNIEPFDYEAARKEVKFGEGHKGRQGKKEVAAGQKKKGSGPEQSEFGQGKRRQAFPASGNRSATFKS